MFSHVFLGRLFGVTVIRKNDQFFKRSLRILRSTGILHCKYHLLFSIINIARSCSFIQLPVSFVEKKQNK